MTSHASVASVLESARQALAFAVQGRADFDEAGERRLFGLHTAVTNARSVTFVIQNLRSFVDAATFDAWYQGALDSTFGRHPDVSAWFIAMRNRIEKQGTAGGLSTEVHIRSFSMSDLGPRPVGAVASFVGDHLGRSGWKVRLPDGTETIVYTKAPEGVSVKSMRADAPGGASVDDLLAVYLGDCAAFVALACDEFEER